MIAGPNRRTLALNTSCRILLQEYAVIVEPGDFARCLGGHWGGPLFLRSEYSRQKPWHGGATVQILEG